MSSVHLFAFFLPQDQDFQFMEEQRKSCPDLWAAASPANPSPWLFPHFSRQEEECCCFPCGSTNKPGGKQQLCQGAFPGFRNSSALISISSFPQEKCHPFPHPFPHPFSPITVCPPHPGIFEPNNLQSIPGLRALLETTKLQENTERANT